MELWMEIIKQKLSLKLWTFSYPSVVTYVLGAQKNCLIETVLLSTHNICLGWEKKNIGSTVVECLTRDRGAAGSRLSGVTALWSLSKTHLSYFSTGSTQEDPSQFNWKIVDGT